MLVWSVGRQGVKGVSGLGGLCNGGPPSPGEGLFLNACTMVFLCSISLYNINHSSYSVRRVNTESSFRDNWNGFIARALFFFYLVCEWCGQE